MTGGRERPVGYGLVGCGGFGRFCLEQYAGMHSLKRIAVADADEARARETAGKFALESCSVDDLLAREDVDLVHVATPPFTHHDLVTRALAAGKHVLCEKPLAVAMDGASEMADAAKRAGRVLAVNLIMRYNPLCAALKKIVDGCLLGEPLHGFFENYAKDEPLPAGHWFWAREKSGGIFIEHGVHFFDLFAWWLGEGRVVAAQETRRPGTDIVEQVACTAMYGDVPVNFYHGFHQPARMDRQEMRLLFERGSLSLDEWVPTRARIDAIADRKTLAELRDLAPGPEPEIVEEYQGEARKCSGRHKQIEVDGRYRVTLEAGIGKQELYGQVLRALLDDQLAAIADPGHRRRVDESNGVSSLEMAVAADRLARGA